MSSSRICPAFIPSAPILWRKWSLADYLVKEKPDAIINIVDGTNVERNLYLTTQLLELGIPVVIAVNMIDIVRKNGDKIDLAKLGAELGLRGDGNERLEGRGQYGGCGKSHRHRLGPRGAMSSPMCLRGSVEHAIAHIEESICRQSGCAEPALVRYQAF